jgi:solute carrier family 8 (sodium/calcium exchanger)
VDRAAHVTYKTRDGTAKAGSDYVHAEGVLSFGPGVTEQSIKVTILDDNAFELDEDFFVDLYEPKVEGEGVLPVLGCTSSVSVVIIEDDLPGELSFTEEQITVHETPSGCEVDITVQRKQGCTGLVSCRCYTQDDTAKAGVDYEGFDTTLQFQEGETAITIQCAIKGRGRYDCREMFRVILEDVEGGASFNASTDGGRDSCVLSVFIEPQGQEANEKVDRIMQKLARKWQKSSLGHSNWKDQFIDALYVNGGCGGKDKEDDPNSRSSTPFGNNTSIMPTTTESSLSTLDEPPGVGDYVMHVISLPWKLLFALVPPPDFCGGWLCFFCSLMMIALVTAVIGDMAAMLGCVLTIPDEITAITFVALGTSLPDTFASRTAAVEDKTADASVGNVTGSNSVNVFLGLGLPWSIGSIYWAVKGSDQIWDAKYKYDPDIQDRFRGGGYFIVKAGTLGFSVAIFSCCALSAIALLYVRRRVVGGELGGPRHLKLASALCLVGLWVFYVALSSWNALQNKQCG